MSKWMNKDDYAGPVYTVDDAVLNKFSVTSNKTLEYELALTLNAENKFFANTEMKWEVFETVPVYENNELGNKVDLAPFEIKKTAKKELKPTYKGETKTSVDASKVKNAKLVDIVLKLRAKRSGKTVYLFKVQNDFAYECNLKVPTKSGGGNFECTKCERKKEIA
ncbi:hypothetical protein ACLB2K_056284 [Fragaria x ananassa]|uniref:uncharacterized protein LOC105352641 n=1 Tax=Fragaria vesca subsp. vesca TaxID=101020 RepID=UPI0005C973ED|nr:PREDICTED: uncharacterized protein LOC105352641 [Fragaria vesca subsp. vesca]